MRSAAAFRIGIKSVHSAAPPAARLLFPHKLLWVQQVPGPERFLGPSRRKCELDSDKISDLPEYTVTDVPPELLFGRLPADLRPQRKRAFELQAGTRLGDVLQEPDGPPIPSTRVPPVKIDHIGT